MNSESRPMPLDGVRVIEMGHFLAGPFASTMLGDFGAEVIKVESPTRPDLSRHSFGRRDPRDPERSPFFTVLNRNKKGFSVDLATDRGRELLLRLIGCSDVFIENFRPGTMEKWGLGFEELKRQNPHILLLRLSGFGQVGPRRTDPGVDDSAQAFGGLTYMTGEPCGPPIKPGMTVADHGAAVLGALAVALALLARHNAPAGIPTAQEIDVSLYDPMLLLLDDMPAMEAPGRLAAGTPGERTRVQRADQPLPHPGRQLAVHLGRK